MTPSKYCWISEFEVSFDQDKQELVLDLSTPIPSHLDTQDLSFEIRVIAYIIATTLLFELILQTTLTHYDTMLI